MCPWAHQFYCLPSLNIVSHISSPGKQIIESMCPKSKFLREKICSSIWVIAKQCSAKTSSHLNSNYGSKPSGTSLRVSLKSTTSAEYNHRWRKQLASLVLNIHWKEGNQWPQEKQECTENKLKKRTGRRIHASLLKYHKPVLVLRKEERKREGKRKGRLLKIICVLYIRLFTYMILFILYKASFR